MTSASFRSLEQTLALLRQTCRGSAEQRVASWGPGLVPGETKASAAAPRSGERSSATEVCRSSASFPNLQSPEPLFWSHLITTPSGLPVRLIGLNAALLAADDSDKGNLRLGKEALARTLTGLPDNELTLILSHHPFRDNWLADQRQADSWIKGPGRIHLSGHVHEADSEGSRAGSGTSLLRITAGAVHGDKLPPGVPASHGYSFAAVVPGENGTLRLRVWPRRWSEKNKFFTVDTDNTPKDRPYAEHTLPGLIFRP